MSIYQQWSELELPQVSDSSLYVLAESSQYNTLLAQMEFHDVYYRALWYLEKKPELAKYAPYLIQTTPNSDFDHWLTQNKTDIAFTIIKTHMEFDTLYKHLKHFSKFEDLHTHRRYFLRLGSSPMLYMYTRSIAQQHHTVTAFFAQGRIDGYLFQDASTHLLMYCMPYFGKTNRDRQSSEDGYLIWNDLLLKR